MGADGRHRRHRRAGRTDQLTRRAASWQLVLRLVVAPFYISLFIITAVGAMSDKRT